MTAEENNKRVRDEAHRLLDAVLDTATEKGKGIFGQWKVEGVVANGYLQWSPSGSLLQTFDQKHLV